MRSRSDGDREPRRVLQCNACGRETACSAEELLRYTREGWPRCCGHALTFYTETAHPADVLTPASQNPPAST